MVRGVLTAAFCSSTERDVIRSKKGIIYKKTTPHLEKMVQYTSKCRFRKKHGHTGRIFLACFCGVGCPRAHGGGVSCSPPLPCHPTHWKVRISHGMRRHEHRATSTVVFRTMPGIEQSVTVLYAVGDELVWGPRSTRYDVRQYRGCADVTLYNNSTASTTKHNYSHLRVNI